MTVLPKTNRNNGNPRIPPETLKVTPWNCDDQPILSKPFLAAMESHCATRAPNQDIVRQLKFRKGTRQVPRLGHGIILLDKGGG